LLRLTDTSFYIYICVEHFGMANIKNETHTLITGINKPEFLLSTIAVLFRWNSVKWTRWKSAERKKLNLCV